MRDRASLRADIPAGYRLGLAITGCDFQMPGDGPWPSLYGIEIRGNGTFVHDDPVDRPAEIFAGRLTVHTGTESSILLPVIPAR